MSSGRPIIYVAGHRGMVGSAIYRELLSTGHRLEDLVTHARDELDLTNQAAVLDFFRSKKIDQVYLAAAKVGGIKANNCFPADFVYENLMIEANVIHSCFLSGVKRLLFLGSSCIYPKFAPQPISEEAILSGFLEPTNAPYAIAKIAGLAMCENYNRQYGKSHNLDYRSLMPTNLYGPGDNYDIETSHVIPALIHRFHEAKLSGLEVVKIWGTGSPLREFLFVEDLARACVHVMNLNKKVYQGVAKTNQNHMNVGAGKDIAIRDLASLIAEVVGYNGKMSFDPEKPDGTPKKLLNSERINKTGWSPKVNLTEGLKLTYEAYLSAQNKKKH